MRFEELVNEFLFDCEVRELSAKTIDNYRKQLKCINRFFSESCGVKNVEDLKPTHIKQFISYNQKRGCKPSYTNDLLKVIKVICNYAFSEGYTEDLLTKKVRNVKEPKVLIHTFTEEEIRKLINHFNGSDFLSIRNKVIFMILFDTGIRASELMTMKTTQIQENYFIIYGKRRKERVVPKTPLVSKWLLKYLYERDRYFAGKDAEDYVFLSKNGRQLTCEALSKFMKKAAVDVGVNPIVRVSPHTCRHTFAQQQLKNGLDLYSLSRLLGHESVAITQRYLEALQDSQILVAAKRTSVLLNLGR